MLSLRSVAFILLPFLAFPSFITTSDDPLDKIAALLSNWTSKLPQEKVYLHLDKPYYAVGDTIWFKAYVTIGSRHQLSAMSGALYADLINERDSVEKTIKLPVTAGTAMGDFTLSDILKEGNYRIRAYTQWMRNAGEDYYFDRTFSVGNAFSYEVVAKVDYQYKTVGDKPVVIALLNYTDEEGKPLAGKEVKYEIKASQKVAGSEKGKTDARGNISIDIINDQQSDLKGAYIRTSIQTEGKKKVSKSFPIKAALSQSDVQFFPESGNLVNGISSRLAFKAVGIDGTGVAIKGTITDNTNQEVVSFESRHAGMGTFNLKPEAGKTYNAKITYPDGSGTTLSLPKAEDDGYVLAVYINPDEDSLLVRVNASAKQYQTPQSISLVAQSGGEMIYASQIKIIKPVTSVWIPKKDFPTGIAQFTLFSSKGIPLNERIAFIRNPDQMQVKLSAAKQSYKTREKVEIEVEVKDQSGKPVAGNFSVAVIDESKVPVDEATESTIFSNILLTSDLKGYIEKPNFYFTKETEETDKALDNLMLTQGYRRFIWKDLLKETPAQPIYQAEKLTTEITGKVLSLTKKPVPYGKVTLFSLKAGVMIDTTTDAAGRFKFKGLVLTDSLKFTVQARTEKNGKNVEVILDQVALQGLNPNKNIGDINTNITDTIKNYLANSKTQNEVWEKQGKLNRVQQLKEVVVRAAKESEASEQGMIKIPPGRADQTFILENPDLCANLANCLQGRLQGVVFQPVEYLPDLNEKDTPCFVKNWPHYYEPLVKAMVPMQIILDGRKVGDCVEMAEIFDNNALDPTDIVKIEVVRSGLAQKSILNGASLAITTKRGWVRKSYNPSIANITPKGFNQAREFYSPRYDHPKTDMELPDLRSTIYWNPAIKTTTDGKTKFDFFNAHDAGTYKVIIEGINAEGELGRQVYRYKVE
ncbi:MAG: carboxypeptidase-like regulatory domain-containing protein [Daejeonella sp.]